MQALIINATQNISATEIFNAVQVEGNVHTVIDGQSFIIKGANIHLCRIYTRLTGERVHYLRLPTILSGRAE